MGFKPIKYQNITLPQDSNLFCQTYEKADMIDGVQILKLNTFADDFGGWFKETLRLDEKGNNLALKELGIEFKPVQGNMSYLAPYTQRFWHIHPVQNEIWTTNGTILLGLIDFRTGSPTYGKQMKIVLSSEKLVYIPAGLAHGFINPSTTPVTLNYFTDKFFVATEDTQECRIDPAKVSFDFVKPETM
ncbi:MAG TPA: dTDP-4-dehydrorhamnose 3,5-epimerase family protein [Candidatus Woesebacteria bacterium]|nr:dTDP-4-dehydrorhamnose 3,5-epimerase family protein [Candidatus Woesebacteria bacterium]